MRDVGAGIHQDRTSPLRTIPHSNVNPSEIFLDPIWIEPADFLECLPKLRGLIDINLASLLSICLSELFANSKSVDPLDKDSSLRCEVGSTVETEVRSKEELIWMKEIGVYIIFEIDRSASPVDFERVWLVR